MPTITRAQSCENAFVRMDCHKSLDVAIVPKAILMFIKRSYFVRTLVICALIALPATAADKLMGMLM